MTRNLLLTVLWILFSINTNAQNALNFDGQNDFVQTTMPAITGSNTKTIEAWIKITANSIPNASGVQHVIADFGSFVTGGRFTFNILWSNAIRLEVGGSGLSGTIAVNDGLWHHVAVVYNMSAANSISLYVDGVLDVAGNISTSVNTLTGNMIIGKRVDGLNYFDGEIDEVRVWNTARTLSELIANKNTEYCGTPTGLIAYYKFNQGVAAANNSSLVTLTEYSPNSYTGTLYNFALNGAASNWVAGATLTPGTGTTSNISVSACGSYTSPSGNYVWNTNGTYIDTIQNVAGCDSIMTISLIMKNSSASSISVSSCNEYISPSGKLWDTSNIYTDTIANAVGCDSVITIDLTIGTIDNTVSVTSLLLTAIADGVSYQWVYCNNNYAIISGATEQFYAPWSNGDYAVIVSNGICTDTSICNTISGVGFQEIINNDEIKVFPNPVKDFVSVDLFKIHDNIIIEILDVSGKQIIINNYKNTKDIKLNISELRTGYYLLKIRTNDVIYISRIIKE